MNMTNDGLAQNSFDDPAADANTKDSSRIYSKYYNKTPGKRGKSDSVNASPMKSQGPMQMDDGQLPEVKGALRNNNNDYQ